MGKNRMEAFSDGVLAIIITIMVLELKIPLGSDFASLKPLLPVFFSYILSFVYLGIYWNNHHHMLHVTEHVSGSILWANLHLLFWLSLFPFVTGVDGREPLRSRADHPLWRSAVHGCRCLLYPAAGHHRKARPGIPAGYCRWKRFQRKDLAVHLCRCDWNGFCRFMDLASALCSCCGDVADPGPPH